MDGKVSEAEESGRVCKVPPPPRPPSGSGATPVTPLEKGRAPGLVATRKSPRLPGLHGKVRYDEIIKRYQYAKEQYAIIDRPKIERLKRRGEKSISIEHSIRCDMMDTTYSPMARSASGSRTCTPARCGSRRATSSRRCSSAGTTACAPPAGRADIRHVAAELSAGDDHHGFEVNVANMDLPASETKLARTLISAMSTSDKEFDYGLLERPLTIREVAPPAVHRVPAKSDRRHWAQRNEG